MGDDHGAFIHVCRRKQRQIVVRGSKHPPLNRSG
jgi:hypothetical protein